MRATFLLLVLMSSCSRPPVKTETTATYVSGHGNSSQAYFCYAPPIKDGQINITSRELTTCNPPPPPFIEPAFAGSCISAWTKSIPGDSKNYYLYAENHCGHVVKVIIMTKFVDKEGYRVGVDAGIEIPDFAPTDKVRHESKLIIGSVGAQIRAIEVSK